MKSYNNQQDKTWNSSEMYLERMERRWEDCDQAKLSGDTTAYFRSLETIYRNAHPFFNDEEKAECEEFVKKIESFLSAAGDRAFKNAGLWTGENQCDRFRMLIVGLLFKYRITYTKASKPKSWEELIDEDFQ
jgi:hypothetical protein